MPTYFEPRLRGMFGFQPHNNRTRVFEYPWAFFATEVKPGMLAVDIGGSLGGFQFVLSRLGLDVTNVDPGEGAAMGWTVDAASIQRLNRAFGTNVRLCRTMLADAALESERYDRVFCLSTLEHVPPAEIPLLVTEIRRILKPGGKCVLTVDLFLDLYPFTDRELNRHGTNINIASLVESSGMELEVGDRSELLGFPEFRPANIQSQLDDFLFGDIAPCVAQSLVLARR